MDKLTQIVESRVDWTGKYFLFEIRSGADQDLLVTELSKITKVKLRKVTRDQYADLWQSYLAGEPWMRSGETMKLSEKEAEVLGERLARTAAEAASLTESETQKLVSIVREELLESFRKIHDSAEDLSSSFAESGPFLERIRARTEEIFGPETASSVMSILLESFGDPTTS